MRKVTKHDAKWSFSSVGSLAEGELTRRLRQLFSSSVDGQVAWWPRCLELPCHFEPYCRSEPSVSELHSASTSIGSHSSVTYSCLVENCAVSSSKSWASYTLMLSTNNCTWPTRRLFSHVTWKTVTRSSWPVTAEPAQNPRAKQARAVQVGDR